MSNTTNISKVLYKEIKNYKKLENHWIIGEISNISNSTLDKRFVQLNFTKPEYKNSFKRLSQLFQYKNFKNNRHIYYDQALKKLVFKNQIYIWYNNDQFQLTKSINKLYFNKNYIDFRYKINRNLFKNIEQKKFKTLLANYQSDFLYYNTLLKINKYKYKKNIFKKLIKNFIKRQNILALKKKNIKLKGIILGINNKTICIYIPKFFNIYTFNVSVDLKKNLKKKFNTRLKKVLINNLKSKNINKIELNHIIKNFKSLYVEKYFEILLYLINNKIFYKISTHKNI